MKYFLSANTTEAIGLVANAIPNGHSWTLASMLGSMLAEAEERFGPRDKDWAILGVEFSSIGGPQVWYPGNRMHVAVQLGAIARTSLPHAIYQLAHEIIHLLQPTGGNHAPVLEEGLATVFSEDISSREKLGIWTSDPKYKKAAALTRQLLTMDADAIGKLRSVESAFHKMTPDLLRTVVPKMPAELAETLCLPFAKIPTN